MNRNCKYSSQSAWARGSHFICRGLSISMGFLRCSCFLSVENAGIPLSSSACPAVSTRGGVANGLQNEWSSDNGDARGPGAGSGPAPVHPVLEPKDTPVAGEAALPPLLSSSARLSGKQSLVNE